MLKKRNLLIMGLFLLFFLISSKNIFAIYTPCNDSDTSSCDFRYNKCDQSKGTCTGTGEFVVTGNSTEMCGTGWKAVCGFDQDGYIVTGAPDLCSCVKLATGEVPATLPPNTSAGCTCKKDNSTGSYIVATQNCGSLTAAQCHDGGKLYPGPDCSCLTAGTIQQVPTKEPASNSNVLCDGDQGVNTALGCIPIGSSGFTSWILGWLFGIAGGIAFLLMVYGFILVATSGGDEKKVQGAKETITSAIVGLLVCIFAVFILKLVAVNILQIPGF